MKINSIRLFKLERIHKNLTEVQDRLTELGLNATHKEEVDRNLSLMIRTNTEIKRVRQAINEEMSMLIGMNN
jgi:hypothetical protein